MRTSEIIDNGLAYGDNVSESDEAYVERRRRALVYLREVYLECYVARAWPRRKTSATLTVPARSGRVAVPWDFARVGPYGPLYLGPASASRGELDEKNEQVILDLRAAGTESDSPSVYSIFDIEAVGIDALRDLIQITTNPTALTLELNYCRKAPRLLDAKDPDAADTTAVVLARTGTTVTATTPTAHSFTTDDWVVIADADDSAYDGSVRIIVTGATTFTYEIVGAPATPDAGTVAWDVARGDVATAHIPEEFHITLLCKGLKAKLRESKGDERWTTYQNEYAAALDAVKRERSRFNSALHQLPSFFGGS